MDGCAGKSIMATECKSTPRRRIYSHGLPEGNGTNPALFLFFDLSPLAETWIVCFGISHLPLSLPLGLGSAFPWLQSCLVPVESVSPDTYPGLVPHDLDTEVPSKMVLTQAQMSWTNNPSPSQQLIEVQPSDVSAAREQSPQLASAVLSVLIRHWPPAWEPGPFGACGRGEREA